MGPTQRKRKETSASTAKRLYLVSGNMCAFPDCRTTLMSTAGVLVGEIAHICAASSGGPRFDPGMKDAERASFENLMLMCATHHTAIDKAPEQYPADVLRGYKKKHEAVYTNVAERLLDRVSDVTADTAWTSPSNLAALAVGADELSFCIDCVNQSASRLAKVPVESREVLAIVVTRGTSFEDSGPGGSREVAIPMSLLEGIVSCSRDALIQHIELLAHAGFGGIQDEFYGEGSRWEFQVGRSTAEGWPLFSEIAKLAGGDAAQVRAHWLTSISQCWTHEGASPATVTITQLEEGRVAAVETARGIHIGDSPLDHDRRVVGRSGPSRNSMTRESTGFPYLQRPCGLFSLPLKPDGTRGFATGRPGS